MKVIVTKLAFHGNRRVRKGEEIELTLAKGAKLPSWCVPAPTAVKKAKEVDEPSGGDAGGQDALL